MAELSIFRRSDLISLIRTGNGNRKELLQWVLNSCLWKAFSVLGTSVCAWKPYPFPALPTSPRLWHNIENTWQTLCPRPAAEALPSFHLIGFFHFLRGEISVYLQVGETLYIPSVHCQKYFCRSLWLLYLILMDIAVWCIAWSSSSLVIISSIIVPFFCKYSTVAGKRRCRTVAEKPVAFRSPDEYLSSILWLKESLQSCSKLGFHELHCDHLSRGA